jgi:putative GTP pyrophosphokinase
MSNPVSQAWKEKPEIVRSYYENLSTYQRLCEEVEYILDKKIKSLGIKIGNLSSRAKTLESFCEKIQRKKYDSPLTEITDLSGVRIVFLYPSDRIRLEQLVEGEFHVKEKVDKFAQQKVEQFGYGALHYIIQLKEQHAGARYDDLRDVSCEIQIRTILQDAWSIVAHHLSYKQEDDIPNELRRKLHALSGLFEIGDDQFEGLNLSRTEYQKKIARSLDSHSDNSLDTDLNLDSLLAYLASRFPDRAPPKQQSAADLLFELNKFGYKSLREVDAVIATALDAVLASEKVDPPTASDTKQLTVYTGVGLLRGCLEFVDDGYFKYVYGSENKDIRKEFSHLLKKELKN